MHSLIIIQVISLVIYTNDFKYHFYLLIQDQMISILQYQLVSMMINQ